MTATTASVPGLVRPPPGERDVLDQPSAFSAGAVITGILVIGPVAALAIGIPLLWGRMINPHDLAIAAGLYVFTGLGIAIGYHRLFAHRAFTPNRPLKIALAVAGSMAVEGSVIGWTANHRRHHRFSDRPGDPHSPRRTGPGWARHLRGLLHAHVGWLFGEDTTERERYVPELMADRDLVVIGRLWGVFAVGSLVLPFLLGWTISGSLAGGLSTFLWAGAARMMLLHHTTWSVNSMCHTFGRRPFRTRDGSTNLAVLAPLSFGESYHNFHHAYPSSARHGVLPRQVDSAAAVIRLLERVGWATEVRWPEPGRVAALRRAPRAPSSAGDPRPGSDDRHRSVLTGASGGERP